MWIQLLITLQDKLTFVTDSKLVRGSFDEKSSFSLTDDFVKADIIWSVHAHFKDYDTLLEHQFVSEFPYELFITSKSNLSKFFSNTKYTWFIQGFDAAHESHLRNFLLQYNLRKLSGFENTWIGMLNVVANLVPY